MTYPTLQVAVDVPSYTDITAYVCHDTMQISRGRSDPSGDFQPATGTFSLINTDGRFDPSDTSGPYTDNFRLRTPVYIYATLSGDTFMIAKGWITSIRQRWNHRGEQIAEVSWIDALGILATYELPESAWDYVIAGRTGKVCWFKLGDDTTSTARDYSGNEAHGRYVTYEGSVGPYGAGRTPDVVVREGVSSPLIPQVDRPGRSWGKMIAAADQPLNSLALGDNWRSTAIVCDQSTATLQTSGQNWSIEAWLTIRPAFALNNAGVKAGNQISSGLYQWGETAYWNGTASPGPTGPMTRIGWYVYGSGLVTHYKTTGGINGLVLGANPLDFADDPTGPIHLVLTRNGSTLTWYVDGNTVGITNMASVPLATGFPLVIGAASAFGWNESFAYDPVGFNSEIGDVVVYNRALSLGEIRQSHYAGRYGRTDGFNDPLLPGEAFSQVINVADADFPIGGETRPIDDGSHYVIPGPWNRRNALDYIRLIARSENGQVFAEHENESVRFLPSNWQLAYTPASSVQWIITDDDIADPGGGTWGTGDIVTGHTGGALSVDDGGLINDVTVTWRGGTVPHSDSTSVGTFGRLRRSIDTALSDVRDAKSRAEWEVWRYGSVVSKISSITVEPADETSWYAALSLDLLHRVRVILTRPDGSQFDQECFVESITHSIDMGQGAWRTTLGLSAADLPAAPFVIDSSEIAGPDVVWY